MRSLISVVVLVSLFFSLQVIFKNVEQEQLDNGQIQLEQAIRKAAVACYAMEGIYPPDLDYIKEYYGIQIDEKRYVVVYDVFAENLMPDITVLKK